MNWNQAKLIIFLGIILAFSSPVYALEATVGFGPLLDTNVAASAHGGKANFVFDIQVRKTKGWWLPFIGIQTLFGDNGGVGSFNPVVNTWQVGTRFKLNENLFIVVDHWSKHTVDGYRPTEKFTAIKLEHVFKIGE